MVLTIFKKEMIDILRDKKTLFMGIVLPLILYPVLMIVMTQIMSMTMNGQDSKDINIAFEKSNKFSPQEKKIAYQQGMDMYKRLHNYNEICFTLLNQNKISEALMNIKKYKINQRKRV